jgi:ssDNA-binding Zn-finger/Zn-ribbon topoisomerase 1
MNMALKKPNSMEECLYFTNRSIGDGFATAWVYRGICPKCTTPTVGKPIKKNGKVDKKADVYECSTCKYQEPNEETEAKLKVEIQYKCPHCGNEGETTTEYARKTFEGVPSYVFECGKCNKKIGITKKMKKSKKK